MSMPTVGDDPSPALNATGVDFSNNTQAMDFLGQILDDTDLQISGNKFAEYFWCGIVTAITVGSFINLLEKANLRLR